MTLRVAALTLALLYPAHSVQAALLRVMTYNIHHAVGKDGNLDLARIASVISAANPDIVSLQEVDNFVPRSGNVSQMNQLGSLTGMQSYFGKARNLNGGGYGNGVLVRNGIDIRGTTNHQLPNPDNVEARAVIEMNLSIDSNANTTEFKFFATHLMHDSSAGRIASANFINDLVSGSSTPAILAGDMNYNPGSPAFNITDNQWDDATNVANSGKNRANQIDYIFYRSNSQWSVDTASQFIINPTTNVASDHHPLLGVLDLATPWPDAALVWNINSGVATGVSDGFATGNGNQQFGYFPASPWSSEYNTGQQNLIIGYNGNATLTGNATRVIGSLRIGTDAASAIISGRNGNGAMTVSNTVTLTVAKTVNSTGDLTVGEGGYAGAFNWNSSSTLDVQGRLRVGQDGTGILNQNDGLVSGGANASINLYPAVGAGVGAQGTYNLNHGTLRAGSGYDFAVTRQTIVGESSGVGVLNVGDGAGAANSALVQANDNVVIGRTGGTGALNVHADGKVDIRSAPSADAALIVGHAATGVVTQTGGLVTGDGSAQIGVNAGGSGQYLISGGSLATASDGSGALQIGHNGGSGTIRVQGSGSLSHGAEAYIGSTGSGSTGRLELIGSAASAQIGQLENAAGVSESIRWEADASGVTPLVVTGAGPLASNRVQLQDPTEVAANAGSGATLSGDGIGMELKLSSYAASGALTLVNNQSTDAVTGYFENPNVAGDLYEQNAAVYGAGYAGTARISYTGGTGNDVVMNLTSFQDDARQIVRLQADSVTGADGAAVSSWSDLATGDSFAGTVSQSNAAAQPVKRIGAINGRSAIEFDGVNDLLASSQTNSLTTASGGVTVFLVATADQGTETGERAMQIGRSTAAGGTVAGLDLSRTSTSNSEGGAGFRFNNGRALYDAGVNDSDFHIIAFQVGHNEAYSQATMYVDGTLPANTFTGQGTSGSTVFNGSQLELLLGGGRLNGGGMAPNDYYNGQIAELMVYNGQLSVQDMNIVADYLSTTYALPFAFDFTGTAMAGYIGGSPIPEPASTGLLLGMLPLLALVRSRASRNS